MSIKYKIRCKIIYYLFKSQADTFKRYNDFDNFFGKFSDVR